jgi:tetratricopeptide (TPR) repeat protein
LLSSLADKSLVVYELDENGQARYRLLETVKQYAGELLLKCGEADVVRTQHLDFYLRLAEQAEVELGGARQTEWVNRLDTELDNLRAAREWCAEQQETETELHLTAALWRFWWIHSFFVEGAMWQERALEKRQDTSISLQARVLIGAGLLAHHRSDQQRAAAMVEEALDLYRQMGESRGMAFALAIRGWAALCVGDLERATHAFTESLTLARAIADPWLIAYALIGSGVEVAMHHGHTEAIASLEEALLCCRAVGDPYLINYALLNLALQRYYLHDLAQARTLIVETVQISLPSRNVRAIAGSLEGLAYVSAGQQPYEVTARLLGAAEGLRESTGAPLFPQWYAAHEDNEAVARAALGEEGFETAWLAGRNLTMEQAVTLALAPIPPSDGCSD